MLRRVVCLLVSHRWAKVPYPEADGDAFSLRCRRCGRSTEATRSGVEGAMGWSAAPWSG